MVADYPGLPLTLQTEVRAGWVDDLQLLKSCKTATVAGAQDTGFNTPEPIFVITMPRNSNDTITGRFWALGDLPDRSAGERTG